MSTPTDVVKKTLSEALTEGNDYAGITDVDKLVIMKRQSDGTYKHGEILASRAKSFLGVPVDDNNNQNTTPVTQPTIVSPAQSQALTGATQTWTWTNNDDYDTLQLIVDDSLGTTYFASASLQGNPTSLSADNLPINGSIVRARLFWSKGTQNGVSTATYTAFQPVVQPVITQPLSGASLAGTNQQVLWSNPDTYDSLQVVADDDAGTDYFRSGILAGNTTSITPTGLPDDGSPVVFRIQWFKGADVGEVVVAALAFDAIAAPVITAPDDASTLDAVSQLLTWNNPDVYDSIRVTVDNNSETNQQIYFTSALLAGTATSVLCTSLPNDGGPVCFTVEATRGDQVVSSRVCVDAFTVGASPSLPTLSIANNGAIAGDATITAATNGSPVTTWSLAVGTEEQFDDLTVVADKGASTPATRSSWRTINTPGGDATIHYQFQYDINGQTTTENGTFISRTVANLAQEPILTAPAQGMTLNGPALTVIWDRRDWEVDDYILRIGTTLDGEEITRVEAIPAGDVSRTITVPTDGAQLFVFLTAHHTGGGTTELRRVVTAATGGVDNVFATLPRWALQADTSPATPPLPGIVRPDFIALRDSAYNVDDFPTTAFGAGVPVRPDLTRANVFETDLSDPNFTQNIQGVDLSTTMIRHNGPALVRDRELPNPRHNLVLDLNGSIWSGARLYGGTFTTTAAGWVFNTETFTNDQTDINSWDLIYYNQFYSKIDALRRPVDVGMRLPRLAVFVDGRPQLYVQNLADLQVDRYTIDLNTGAITLGTNPDGRVVEIGTRQIAWSRGGDAALHSSLRNGTVEKYACGVGIAAIGAGTWTTAMCRDYVDLTVQWCNATGIEFASFGTHVNVDASDNGQLGAGSVGSQNNKWTDCTFNRNNWQFINQGDHAGGFKVSSGDFRPVQNLHFVRCTYNDNHGIGKWNDFMIRNMLEYRPTATGNERSGYYLEVVYRCWVVHPVLSGNCTYRQSQLNGYLGANLAGHNCSFCVIYDPLINTGADAGTDILESSGSAYAFINNGAGDRNATSGDPNATPPVPPTFKTGVIYDWDGNTLEFNHPTRLNRDGNNVFGDARTQDTEIIGGTMTIENTVFSKQGFDGGTQIWSVNGCYQDQAGAEAGFDVLAENPGMVRGSSVIVTNPATSFVGGTPFTDGFESTTTAATWAPDQLADGATLTINGVLEYTAP